MTMKQIKISDFRLLIFSICVLSFLTILSSEVYSQKTNNSPLPFNQAAVKQSTAPALQGTDASKPYFHVRFALPIPPDNDKERNGHLVGIDAAVADHHHSPGFEVMPNGDVMIVSFSGPSGREGDPYLRIVQARLRHGAEEFDMPEEITVQGVRMQDLRTADGMRALSGPPLLWREGSTVWMFIGGHHWGENGGGFRVFKSMDNGATWEIVALEPKFSSFGGDAQPITNAFRAPNGDMFVATDASYEDFSFGAGASLLWRSSDNGLTWTDQGGRTSSRHSTIVPLDTKGTLLSAGGKDTNLDNNGVVFKDQFKNGYMLQNISTDWGVTWGAATQSPFPWVGANQRPSVIRLASGNLVLVSDVRHRSLPHTTPAGWTHGDGPFVALSKDNGASWSIKELPVVLKHEHRLHKTIGYSTVRQAPNGMIHVFATMTHPCLHYEFNEAWITDPSAGEMAPETAGGKVKSYKEKYPGGKLRATWKARITPGGRYLLDGAEKYYYPNGKIQREVTWVSGRRTGAETLWGPDGTRIWSWNHDLANNISTWTHWWPNGQKRLESLWNTNPTARDLPGRHFRGLVAHGTARHWNESGKQVGTYTFHNGDRISHRGNYTETFATSLGGWSGSGNTSDGNNFGWSSNTSHSQNGNAGYMRDKGEIGGVFARSANYRWYADTTIGNKNRTDTLHLAGIMRVANENFEGTFRLGYFNTSSPGSNFIGIEIREPGGIILDPLHHGSGTMLRGYLAVNGPSGTTSLVPLELIGGSGNSGIAFELIWTGNPDGSGTLSGTLQSIPMPTITVAPGSGNFNAFGILSGGDNSSDTTKVTGGCWFDNLNYDTQTLPSSSQTLRIMPMGDSNTAGAGRFPGAEGSYRAPLYTLLKKSGYNFDFVGAKTTNGDVNPYPYHWGQGGAQISRTPGTINGYSYISIQGENRGGIYEEMSSAITTDYFSTDTTNTRNIILLQIGINDILHQVVDSKYGSYNTDAGNDAEGEGQEWVAEGMIARLKALLHRIDSLAFDRNLRIEVMLGTTCELTKAYVNDDPVSDILLGEVREYNNYIKTEIPPIVFSNISVKIVDLYTPTVGKLADGLHPNMEGFIGMAKSWYNAIAITHSNVSYGPDKIRNILDFWQAPRDGPRPLLVNIHGGGWITGDKNGYFDYKPFLDRGISCAAINYRFTPDNLLPAPFHDAARAIQFLRTKAAEWNIDPDRIALTGGSAGACTSMWLLLHDDLADPNATDPILRQSTSVCAAAVYAGQTSIDPPVINEWIPSTVPMHRMIPYAVGQQSMANVWPHAHYESKYKATYQEFSPINHLDANDPPLYMEYNRRMNLPAGSDGDAIHHPIFGIKMWEKSKTNAAGHECHLKIASTNEYKTTNTSSYSSGVEFLIDKLLAPENAD